MVIEADLYEERCSLNNEYYSYKEEYSPEIISFTHYKILLRIDKYYICRERCNLLQTQDCSTGQVNKSYIRLT